ncbi:MAG: hypothetical protein CMJ80_10820 [Planctomycetaceae bacterium]|nr:hypothetical protein [Planctomycetaceae bacterium]
MRNRRFVESECRPATIDKALSESHSIRLRFGRRNAEFWRQRLDVVSEAPSKQSDTPQFRAAMLPLIFVIFLVEMFWKCLLATVVFDLVCCPARAQRSSRYSAQPANSVSCRREPFTHLWRQRRVFLSGLPLARLLKSPFD